MANLQNFQKESIQELLEFDYGITQLFQMLVSAENHLPDHFTQKEWIAFDRVLRTQEEAQIMLKNKIRNHVSDFDFQERKDIE